MKPARGPGQFLRILGASITMGLVWTPGWIALFYGLLGLIIVLFAPGSDSDVGTLRMTMIIGWVGFCSGSLFGLILALVEKGRVIGSIPLGRAVLWGILAAAAFPLLTGRPDQVVWTCPFGALIAAGLWSMPAGPGVIHRVCMAISSRQR